ncbi:hypothetical protein ACFFJY_13510 [Fictibacillus aquaticus]|uniref:Uncharacterized protein n=1 Tax=Fictibacillus aquaticus TaxID=2021314 RepID=A0A235FD41_9BACL|nr:hypothetical protein [Fictibacillus aquaticus]OYD59246.1 hypothetical protein CGZ90_04935 [Fictibacillus aquaticus]
MESRAIYYVSTKGEILPVSPDDNIHYFEILVNSKEKHELEHLFTRIHEHNKQEGLDIFSPSRHFNEAVGDRDRLEDNELMFELYRMIYLLGTAETKKELEEMNVLPNLYESKS